MSYNDLQTEHGKLVEKLRKKTALKQEDILSSPDDIFAQTLGLKTPPEKPLMVLTEAAFSKLAKEHYAAELKTEKGLVAQSYDGWFALTPMIHTASRNEIENRAIKNLALKNLKEQSLAEEAKQHLKKLDADLNKAHQKLDLALSNLEEKQNALDHINASLTALKAEFQAFKEATHSLDTKLKNIDPNLELPETRNWHDIKTFFEYLGWKQDSLEIVKQTLNTHSECLPEFEVYQTMREQQASLRETYYQTISDHHQAEREYTEANRQYDRALFQFNQSLDNLQTAQTEIVETLKLDSIDQLNLHIALKDVLAQMYLQGSSDAKYVMPDLDGRSLEPPLSPPTFPAPEDIASTLLPTPMPIPIPELEPVKPHFD